MKKLLAVVMVALVLGGCASSRLATLISVEIGKGFIGTANIGVPEMKKIIVAWPYISGQIAAIPHPEDNISGQARKAIEALDKFAAQTAWTDNECGQISTSLIIIEYEAAKFGWDRYGVTITQWFKTLVGAGA